MSIYSDWLNWSSNVKERTLDSNEWKTVHMFDPLSKTLLMENTKYIHESTLIGSERVVVKKKNSFGYDTKHTVWFLDILLVDKQREKYHRERKLWPIMRMEFLETMDARKQSDNIQYYDGLTLSKHFIERLLKRDNLITQKEYLKRITKIMSPLLKLDTKNISTDLIKSDVDDVCLVFSEGVFYIKLELIENSGRMICKTYIPSTEMTNKKSLKFKALLANSGINLKDKTKPTYALTTSKNHEIIHREFIAEYVITDNYQPPSEQVINIS